MLGALHYLQIPLASNTCCCHLFVHVFIYLVTWLNSFCEAYLPCSVKPLMFLLRIVFSVYIF